MGLQSHRRRVRHLSFAIRTALLFLLISSFYAQLCNGAAVEEEKRVVEERELINRVLLTRRRRLIGPGSSPPICRFKCGRCSPCKPVHVPIQPGLSFPLEYYPEAWRCTCGNKLYMP